jgi:hypothetical protein
MERCIFDQSEARVEKLTKHIWQLPGAKLDISLDASRRQIARCREQYESKKREIETRELAQLNSHLNQGPSAANDQNDN